MSSRKNVFERRSPTGNSGLFYPWLVNMFNFSGKSSLVSPVQTDATLLAKNSQHCWMLHVACCCAKVETGQTFQPTTPNISFVPWSSKRSATMLDPFCTALPTLLGPRTLITHGLQRLMGCILPTMRYRSQTCWELLHPFARSLRINDKQ